MRQERGKNPRREEQFKRDFRTRDGPSIKATKEESKIAKKDDGLSVEKLRKEVLKDTLEHPLTKFSIFVAILSLIFLIFIAPFAGGGVFALFTMIGSAALGCCSWLWNWFIRGKKYLALKSEEFDGLEKKLEQGKEQEELKTIEAELRSDFIEIGYNEGLKALEELASEYNAFCRISSVKSLVAMDRVRDLVRDVYRQGLGVLRTTLEAIKQIEATPAKRLLQETEDYAKTIERLEKSGGDAEEIQRWKERKEANEQHLKIISNQRKRVIELLAESDLCEGQIRKVRLELPTLTDDKTKDEVERMMDELEFRIRFAKERQRALEQQSQLNFGKKEE
ncbi:MAG: hypothetical protein HYV47_01925 [Candidatus Nealsonbacteria bacterium]|nr:hypothetical protein [Candidatus Nealsonbacteria bacterium]